MNAGKALKEFSDKLKEVLKPRCDICGKGEERGMLVSDGYLKVHQECFDRCDYAGYDFIDNSNPNKLSVNEQIKKEKDSLYENVLRYPMTVEEANEILRIYGILKARGISEWRIERVLLREFF